MVEILKVAKKDEKCLVTIRAFKGKVRTRLINCTIEQLQEWVNSDKHIQDVLIEASADDREFLISGTTPKEWAEMFGDDSV